MLVRTHAERLHREATQWCCVHPMVSAHASEGLQTALQARFLLLALGCSSAASITRCDMVEIEGEVVNGG
jgi:hypothetical protein